MPISLGVRQWGGNGNGKTTYSIAAHLINPRNRQAGGEEPTNTAGDQGIARSHICV
jgi:hypothetical protein